MIGVCVALKEQIQKRKILFLFVIMVIMMMGVLCCLPMMGMFLCLLLVRVALMLMMSMRKSRMRQHHPKNEQHAIGFYGKGKSQVSVFQKLKCRQE